MSIKNQQIVTVRPAPVLNQFRESLLNYKAKKETTFDSLTMHELKFLCDLLDIVREHLYN